MPRRDGNTLGDKMTMNQAPGGPGWDPPHRFWGLLSRGKCQSLLGGRPGHPKGLVGTCGPQCRSRSSRGEVGSTWACSGSCGDRASTVPSSFGRPVFSALCPYGRTPQLCSTSLENGGFHLAMSLGFV